MTIQSNLRLGRALSAALPLALSMHLTPAHAQIGACATIADDRERLACYDGMTKPAISPPQQAPQLPPRRKTPFPRPLWQPLPTSSSDGGLRPDLQRGAFNLLGYRPLYALLHATDSINNSPGSPTRSLGMQDVQLDHLEAKLQLSFKTKLAQDLFGSPTDLWFGYTQQSFWQAANSRYSSPFRETDYQPELMVVIRCTSLRAG